MQCLFVRISELDFSMCVSTNVIEVYGVDAIERMLQDLFATSEEASNVNLNVSPASAHTAGK